MSIPISEVEGSLFTVQNMKSFFTTHFETLEYLDLIQERQID